MYRSTTIDVRQAFNENVWAYRCVHCDRLLLKPTAGMAVWQKWAKLQPPGSPPAVFASLPVVVCRRGEEEGATDDASPPLGLCDSCHCLRQIEARRQRTTETPAPATLPSPTTGTFCGQPALAVLLAPSPVAAVSLHPTPPLASGDATTPAGAASTPHRTSDCGPETLHRVVEAGCEACRASAMDARRACEREAATQMQLLKECARAATPTPLCTAAVPPQHPEDAHLGLFSIGGDATPLPPMPATEPWAVPSCQKVLDGYVAGNYDSDEDKSVLEAINNAILLRGDRPHIRLRHNSGRVRIYTKQLLPMKSVIKTSQINKRRAATRRLLRTGGPGVLSAQRGQTRLARVLVRLSLADHVGLIAALSMSHTGLNCWRRALGGSRSGLDSMAHRPELASLPGKQAVVTGSGAHLISLTAAVEETVSALCEADLFVGRRANDALAAAVVPTRRPPSLARLRRCHFRARLRHLSLTCRLPLDWTRAATPGR